MKKNVVVGYIIVQTVICIVVGILYVGIKEENKKMIEMNMLTNETQYKIFYGEWEIVELLPSENVYWERAEYMLGKTIKYTPEAIYVDQEMVLENPVYAYGVAPIDSFFEFTYGRTPAVTSEVIPEDNTYYVYVSVATAWEDELPAMLYSTFKDFYIFDKDKLILDAGTGYYVMERRGTYHDEILQDYYW